MKRIPVLCLALALALGLTSCASMLERDYLVTADHVENPPTQGDSAYRVESYAALRPALLSYVEEGMETGLLHFPTTYGGNLTVDLERARRQLMEEDPLGAYALEELTFQVSRIISYYEVTLTFSYRVTREELQSLPVIRGRGELNALVGETLEDFGEGLTVLMVGYPEGEDPVEAVTAAAAGFFEENPASALGQLQVEAVTYPRTGSRRVVEVHFAYPGSVAALRMTRERLLRRGEELVGEVKAALEEQEDPPSLEEALFLALKEGCILDREGADSPSGALLGGRAGPRGMALAYKLLCDLGEVPCTLEPTAEGYLIHLTAHGGDEVVVDVTAEEFPAPAEEREEDSP